MTTVGLIGLGIMGMAYAGNLSRKGFAVVGYDPVSEARARLAALPGAVAVDSPAEVAARADVILMALPSVAALEAVVSAMEPSLRPGQVVAEMGTLPIPAKEAAREKMAQAGAVLLDCPVSGTGAQAEKADLVVYLSGPDEAGARLRPVLEAIASDVRTVGAFGNGMKLKLVANLLVSIHNLATAEALMFAERQGLDLRMVYEAIAGGGAATSRMFQVRGPLMIEGRYEPATMKMDVYMKDVALIMDQARAVEAPVPLMAATVPYYEAGLAQGRHKQDTAALFAVLAQMAEEGA
ncbi:NAD(P)-dependent oxidoreductase [Tabrizicola sp. M-4]|uniref:NAD(P)-dependent oxidoreductase n=1 Tax=Tabrizicola sp. M-4 TaxID=3055847 RepID=UPI003DAA1B11